MKITEEGIIPVSDDTTANYLDALAGGIGQLVPDCQPDLLRLYALLALTVGDRVTLENVHDAWSAWRAATKPDHPALIPFGELSPEVQALDQPYADAIAAVASHAKPGEPQPPLPPGRFGRIELPGYRNHTGWIAEETRFGQVAAVVRDWDGLVVAEVFPGPACRVQYLPTPLKRPEPAGEQLALARGWGNDDDFDDERHSV